MLPSSLCVELVKICADVVEFLTHVSSVNEESVSDYLLWKWRAADSRFRTTKLRKYTHHEEAELTGADFSLEIWVLGTHRSYPMIFQAKKFQKAYHSYVGKFAYPKGSKAQIGKLLSYSAAHHYTPYYVIYSSTGLPSTKCRAHGAGISGVHALTANHAKQFADGLCGKKLSLSAILSKCRPLPCLFCHGCASPKSLSGLAEGGEPERPTPLENSQVPEYVWRLANGDAEEPILRHKEQQSPDWRPECLAVWDLRGVLDA